MNNTVTPSPLAQLSTYITPDIVQAKVKVSSWEGATDHIGNLLFQAGKIKLGYIAAMKNVLREIGPYVVIAPGIALLHARPENGVIVPCLGVITLVEPVPFGHSLNDPVDLVLALGASDKQSHILVLQQLGNLLGDASELEAIRSAETNQALYEVLTQKTA